tara:strand:+ start:7407 stop:9089 length:1683 start_codon:yes stop_codon:yes gene_type:complete
MEIYSRRDRSMKAWFASGDPWVWLQAGAIGISITAVLGVLLLIAVQGLNHFWPHPVERIEYLEGENVTKVFGMLVERDQISRQQYLESSGITSDLPEGVDIVTRRLIKTANRRSNPPDFRWVFEHRIQYTSEPPDVLVLERLEWGNAYGTPQALSVNGRFTEAITGERLMVALAQELRHIEALRQQIETLQREQIQPLLLKQERLRENLRATDSADLSRTGVQEQLVEVQRAYQAFNLQITNLEREIAQERLALQDPQGRVQYEPLSGIIRAWQPNQFSTLDKVLHFAGNLRGFVLDDPREANTEGGVFPAIFGTVLMVLIMALIVTPFGVIAAIYLHEYAHQGVLVKTVRVAVNNLAGVPSIVYGVFGLGFFVYFLGGSIDALFFQDALPAPTFGTPGLIWASLTLALLTVPIVIVSTEEGLSRIPRNLREGSMALGATKAETLFKVILPMASPAILTGVILAVSRAAGEVAPLMLVGVVKLAPTLAIDGNFPYLHLERKFMHLGFHIYDVGFQSPNVEAARPLVYATALLLITIIVGLNLTAISLRNRLERYYRGLGA